MVESFAFLSSDGQPHKSSDLVRNFPESVSPVTGLEPFSWLAAHILPIGKTVSLRLILPDGYPAYARILHPAYRPASDDPIRWSDLAARHGKTAHPLMQFGRLFGSNDPYHCPSSIGQPFIGQLPEAETKRVAATLQDFTATPEQCYLLVWEGYGGMELFYPPTAKLVLPSRTYLAFTGPIDGVLELARDANMLEGPNLWWPEDKAWIVGTEIDSMETYVGGSAACIDALLGDPEIETFPFAINDSVIFDADTVN